MVLKREHVMIFEVQNGLSVSKISHRQGIVVVALKVEKCSLLSSRIFSSARRPITRMMSNM